MSRQTPQWSIYTLFLCVVFPLAVASQEPATNNLSGVWVREKPKHGLKNYRLTIKQDADLIVMLEEFETEKQNIKNDLKLFPNGRGERNLVMFAGADSPSEIASKTRWKDGKLTRSYTHCYSAIIKTESVPFCSENTEIYSISVDGQELTVSSRRLANGIHHAILDKRKFRKVP